MRVIKKYPNRRLYDAATSRYVTLDDIRRLVVEETPFQVIDRKTGADITHAILLQVVVEQEQREPAVLSESFLAQLIRASQGSLASPVRALLERSLEDFVRSPRAVSGAQGQNSSPPS